jgi:sugar O-acyltransferase (sialic acid O-acetyltransferase NeuD family)
MKKIVLIGGGGFAKEVCEIAQLCGHEVVAYVGTRQDLLARPYWGEREALAARCTEFDAVCIAFGAIDRKSAVLRAETVAWLRQQSFPSLPLVSPAARLAQGALVGDGSIVAHGAVLSVDCSLGEHCIVNSNAIVGHDAKTAANVTVAPGAFIGGNVNIGANTLVGPGAIILEHRIVGENTIVGMGATVARDVPPGATVMPLRSKVIKC